MKRLKRKLHYVGGVLAFVGVLFVVLRLNTYWDSIRQVVIDLNMLFTFGLLSLAYGAANYLLALSWQLLLDHFGVSVRFTWAWQTYGISQIGKYVPGNIFHLAGRQALGVAAGLPNWPLAKSSLWELGLLTGSGSLFAPLVLSQFFPNLSPFVGLILFLAIVCFAYIFLRIFFSNKIAIAFLSYTFFLIFAAAVFIEILAKLSPEYSANTFFFITVSGAYVIAWLAGLVTPGAPAGLGIRELVLLFFLHSIISENNLIVAVASGRVVTAIGDVLFFLVAAVAKQYQHRTMAS